jgi:hypothetical protein
MTNSNKKNIKRIERERQKKKLNSKTKTLLYRSTLTNLLNSKCYTIHLSNLTYAVMAIKNSDLSKGICYVLKSKGHQMLRPTPNNLYQEEPRRGRNTQPHSQPFWQGEKAYFPGAKLIIEKKGHERSIK